MAKAIRILLILAPFTFIHSPNGTMFGLFFRHEFLFQAVVSFALILALISLIRPIRLIRPMSLIDGAVALYWLAYALATAFSLNFHASFFGLADRLTGLLNISYIVAYYGLLRIYVFPRHAITFLRAFSVSAVLIVFYVILQRLGLVTSLISHAVRVFGSFSNPAILAGYLMFGVFVPLFAYLRESPPFPKGSTPAGGGISSGWGWIHLAAAALSFFGILLTQTRAALLGVVAGFVVLSIFAWTGHRFKPWISRSLRAGGVLIAIAAVLITVQIIFAPFAVPSGGILERITSIESLLGGIRNRAITWGVAADVFKARPLLGWGPENFSQGFDRYFDPSLVSRDLGSAESWFDKAHSIYFDTAATMGIAGLLGFLFLVGVTGYAAIRGMRSGEPAYAVLFSALIAYLVNGVFFFDSFESLVALLITAALLSAGGAHSPFTKGGTGVARSIAAVLGIAVIVWCLIAYIVIPARARAWHYRGWQAVNELDSAAAASFYAKDLDLGHPYALYDWENIAQLLLNNAEKIGGRDPQHYQRLAHFAFTEFSKFDKELTPGTRDYYMAARLVNLIFNTLTEEERQTALGYLEKALARSPNKGDVYYELAAYYRNKGDLDRALGYLLQIKDIEIAEQGATSLITDYNLGFLYIKRKEYALAVDSLEGAFQKGYAQWRKNPGEIRTYIDLYTIEDFVGSHMPRLAEFYEARIAHEPENAELHVQLAAIYKELGNYEKARQYALRAAEIDPTIKHDAEIFLKSLDI